MKKALSGFLIVVFLITLLTGCAASQPNDSYYDVIPESEMSTGSKDWFGISADNAVGDMEMSAPSVDYGSNIVNNEDADSFQETTENFVERKIVYSVRTELQTKDLDEALNLIKTNIDKYSGYIQSETQSNNGSIYTKYQRRTVNMTIRIPSEHLNEFLSGLNHENIYTISLNKNSKDYSESYYDKEARIANLTVQENRLLELLKSAADVTTMLKIEERLSDVRYEIESLTREMKMIDSNVDYSTVTLSIAEVVNYDEITEEPVSFFEKVKEAIVKSGKNFVEGLQDFVIWFIYMLPTLVIWIIVIFVIYKVVRKIPKTRKLKKLKNDESKSSTQNENQK